MEIDFDECGSIPIRWTKADADGNMIGMGNLGEQIVIIGICPGGEGVMNVITQEQAYSLSAAMERFEAGYDEVIKIARDGLAEREVTTEP